MYLQLIYYNRFDKNGMRRRQGRENKGESEEKKWHEYKYLLVVGESGLIMSRQNCLCAATLQCDLLLRLNTFQSEDSVRKGQVISAQKCPLSYHIIFKIAERCQMLTKWWWETAERSRSKLLDQLLCWDARTQSPWRREKEEDWMWSCTCTDLGLYPTVTRPDACVIQAKCMRRVENLFIVINLYFNQEILTGKSKASIRPHVLKVPVFKMKQN